MTPQTEHNISIPEYEDKDADKMPEKEFQKKDCSITQKHRTGHTGIKEVHTQHR